MSSTQLFRKPVDNALLFNLLENICKKTEKYYIVDFNAYKKMLYHELQTDFFNSLMEYYHVSKQFYLTRKLSYNSFTNIIRQICKNKNIMFTSNIKYNKSNYTIEYYIYTNADLTYTEENIIS
jgi:hypothetical protein